MLYHPIPTSNHNLVIGNSVYFLLYIILFLHQTTTAAADWWTAPELYIILFLHQTTTLDLIFCQNYQLYIILFLHQTTTCLSYRSLGESCISFYSYIKPQLIIHTILSKPVVYHSIPTSNHNLFSSAYSLCRLYIILFLHQTTTYPSSERERHRLYIILFLHQTTTRDRR